MRAVHPCNNLPKDVAEAPSLEAFKMQLDRVQDNLIEAPFSHEMLSLMIFWVPLQPGPVKSVLHNMLTDNHLHIGTCRSHVLHCMANEAVTKKSFEHCVKEYCVHHPSISQIPYLQCFKGLD